MFGDLPDKYFIYGFTVLMYCIFILIFKKKIWFYDLILLHLVSSCVLYLDYILMGLVKSSKSTC